MKPLEKRITDALKNASTLQELLPEILSSADWYLEKAFVGSAATGHVDNYNFFNPEVFKRAESQHHGIARAIECAIHANHEDIANDILDNVFRFPRSIKRHTILLRALASAARKNNVCIAKRLTGLTKGDFEIPSLIGPLFVACRGDEENRTEIVALMVDFLMRKNEEYEKPLALLYTDAQGKLDKSELFSSLQRHRARVLQTPLEASIRKRSHSITTILLPSFLECAVHNTPDVLVLSKIVQEITEDDYYAGLPREIKLKFLPLQIPAELKYSLLNCLGWDRDNDTRPRDMQLSTGGEIFHVHQDILAYWSAFFSALFRHNWQDRSHVCFDNIISATTLNEVVKFMYCGSYDYQEQQLEQVKDLLDAADYLCIDLLRAKANAILNGPLWREDLDDNC